jgi:hypothetical protein
MTDFGLAKVADPEGDHSSDLVFIHGLCGHRSLTFTNKQGVFWPLWVTNAECLPTARVWTYGYNAKAFRGSADGLMLHATKLLDALARRGVGREVCTTCDYFAHQLQENWLISCYGRKGVAPGEPHGR